MITSTYDLGSNPTKRDVPAIIREVGLDITWDERKVWLLDFPVVDMSIVELAWHFAVPFWSKPNGFFDLSPQEVVDHPTDYPDEYQRTMQANVAYPIDIMFWRGRWLILDGLHRLLQQAINGQKSVKVRKIPAAERVKIVRGDE